MNIFRSSLTTYQQSVDKKGISTLKRFNNESLEKRNNKLSCEYNNETFYFDSTLEKQNLFSSFFAFPEENNLNKDIISEAMRIHNHKISFGNPLIINKANYENNEQRPFIKVPYYPGWKLKTIDGKEYKAINQNNFLGFPTDIYGNKIVQFKYSPNWLFLVYFQLLSWFTITIYFINNFLKKIKKWK
tara:strand:- start:207 stop:767 length:561 start_codon:yes stop_codon:yes gene_type:complete